MMRWFGLCLILAGCGETRSLCTPGASVACACSDGKQGSQVCLPEGTFAACDCGTGMLPMDMANGNPGKRVFVTSTTFAGGALKTACRNSAAAAGLGGTWIPWLSSGGGNIIDIITGNGPWRRLDGQVVFNNKANLATSPLVPLSLTEKGSELGFGDDVWTGTSTGGHNSGHHCRDWTSSSWNDYGTIGVPAALDGWTEYTEYTCDNTAHVYCFEL